MRIASFHARIICATFLFLFFFYRIPYSSTVLHREQNRIHFAVGPKNTLGNSCLPFGVRTHLIIFFIYRVYVLFLWSAPYPSTMSPQQTDSHIYIPWIDSNKNVLCTVAKKYYSNNVPFRELYDHDVNY